MNWDERWVEDRNIGMWQTSWDVLNTFDLWMPMLLFIGKKKSSYVVAYVWDFDHRGWVMI